MHPGKFNFVFKYPKICWYAVKQTKQPVGNSDFFKEIYSDAWSL